MFRRLSCGFSSKVTNTPEDTPLAHALCQELAGEDRLAAAGVSATSAVRPSGNPELAM
ncbi:MAG: hypothetical protein ACXW3P_00815 [Rhodospirillales bacterium]